MMIKLGDMLEAVFSFFGITSQRIEGITKHKCKCGQRKQALNNAGFFLQSKLLSAYFAFLNLRERFYGLDGVRRIRVAARLMTAAFLVLVYGHETYASLEQKHAAKNKKPEI